MSNNSDVTIEEVEVSTNDHSISHVSRQSNTRQTSALISRNLIIRGRRTSARLEPDMWVALYEIAQREGRSIHEICSMIDQTKPRECSLTAAVRVFITAYFRAAATEEGHARAGHGFGNVGFPQPQTVPKRFALKNGTSGLPWR